MLAQKAHGPAFDDIGLSQRDTDFGGGEPLLELSQDVKNILESRIQANICLLLIGKTKRAKLIAPKAHAPLVI